MNLTTLATQIATLHQNTIIHWYQHGITIQETDFLQLVAENHAFNFQLWNAEDRARREDMGHTFVYDAKREIDHFNQQRNNRMEAMDQWFAQAITLAHPTTCPVHSETPGMMIDRLSILSLKTHHMGEQAIRDTADQSHRQTCAKKLAVLREQHAQLTTCLQQLLQELMSQARTFRLYHQFKMYNDPTLNPELYNQVTRNDA
jgi:hypothetical protein